MDSEAARLQHINETIVVSRDAFLGLQNQLAKSFHYIPEKKERLMGKTITRRKASFKTFLAPSLGKCARSLEHQQWIYYSVSGAVQGLGSFGLGLLEAWVRDLAKA